jgi:hypothetical protein
MSFLVFIVVSLDFRQDPMFFLGQRVPYSNSLVRQQHTALRIATGSTSFTALLDYLGSLARVDLRYGDHDTSPTVPTLAEPTATQRRAFELLGVPIPLTLK